MTDKEKNEAKEREVKFDDGKVRKGKKLYKADGSQQVWFLPSDYMKYFGDLLEYPSEDVPDEIRLPDEAEQAAYKAYMAAQEKYAEALQIQRNVFIALNSGPSEKSIEKARKTLPYVVRADETEIEETAKALVFEAHEVLGEKQREYQKLNLQRSKRIENWRIEQSTKPKAKESEAPKDRSQRAKEFVRQGVV